MTEGMGTAIIVILFWSMLLQALIFQRLDTIKKLLSSQSSIDKSDTRKDK
jgi:hypothetical protein